MTMTNFKHAGRNLNKVFFHCVLYEIPEWKAVLFEKKSTGFDFR